MFDSPGGNGLLLSNYVRNAVVAQNEFKFVGDSAIVLLGSTKLCDATDGNQPRGTLVQGNFIHDIGLYGKQGCGAFQSLAMQSTYTHNILFNGPRAGVLWNDGMGKSCLPTGCHVAPAPVAPVCWTRPPSGVTLLWRQRSHMVTGLSKRSISRLILTEHSPV